MSRPSWRTRLLHRLGWSLGAATLWTWGLLLLRMLRDGLQPLEVWFGYGLSFLMTAVYVYMGILIWTTIRAEGPSPSPSAPAPGNPRTTTRLAHARAPFAVAGVLGLITAVVSIVAWLALRYPGPQAVSGTSASVILALMILGVAIISTLIAKPGDE